MKNVDKLYRISNLLSFLAMLVLFLEALDVFKDIAWWNTNWVFGILVVALCVVIVQAKRLDLRRNNPNLIIPISKYAYFGSVATFFVGYLFAREKSLFQIVCYGIALFFDVFSSVSSMVLISKMKRNA